MTAEVALVDAFTATPGAGNRAGVVLETHGLDEQQMQAIARAVAASETAFLISAGARELQLRYFTPNEEIPFCGHATVATLARLAQLGRIEVPSSLEVLSAAGTIPIELELRSGRVTVWMGVPIAPFRAAPLSIDLLMDLVRGRPEMLDGSLRAMACGGQIFVALKQRRDLFSLAPRWDALADAGRAHGIRGFYLFTREVIEPASIAHGRYFAPVLGVREDPVTGSASGPLAYYLVMQGVLKLPKEGGKSIAQLEQGDAMGKPGRVEVEVLGFPGRVDRVRVGGGAVTVLSGRTVDL